jgi:hypothetical protein
LCVINTRFYSYTAIGYSIGCWLTFDVENISNKPIHSFSFSYYSKDQLDTGASGCQPEIIKTGQTRTIKIDIRGKDRITLSLDFVQYIDGEMWFSDAPNNSVSKEGVKGGFKAASDYLLKLLRSDGPDAVIRVLPRIHAEVYSPPSGDFGFYCGVTCAGVRAEYGYNREGLGGIRSALEQSI